ncbi:MAG: hypothetical protein PVI30_15295 [Myxococcales bacterium]
MLLVVVLCGGAGCAPPTAVRRTALIPAPTLPARAGAPLGAGQGRASLELDGFELTPLHYPELNSADEGDPGVLIPDFHLGGSFYLGVSGSIEVGARLQYTHASWSDPNVSGVLPLPDDTDQTLWSGGPGMRLNLALQEEGDGTPITLSLLGELGITSLPEVTFRRAGGTGADGDPAYVLDREEDRLFLIPNLAAALDVGVGHGLDLGLLLGVQQSVTNVGFDSLEHLDDDTTEPFAVGYAGVGVEYLFEPIVVSLYALLPFHGQELIDFGPRGRLQLGYAF